MWCCTRPRYKIWWPIISLMSSDTQEEDYLLLDVCRKLEHGLEVAGLDLGYEKRSLRFDDGQR